MFTGEGGVRVLVKEFVRWIESCFATIGDDFNGETQK